MKPVEENVFEQRYRDRSLKLHVEKLRYIKTRGSHLIDNSCPRTKEIIIPQKQGKDFMKKERVNGIIKDNNKFFEILNEISAGKRETVTQKILHSAKEVPSRKSLNFSVRKKKEIKILEENETLFKRIENTSTVLSVDKLNKEWALLSKYKNSITRKTPRYGSSEFVKTYYLPPLANTLYQNKPGSRNEDNSVDKKKKRYQVQIFFQRKKIMIKQRENRMKIIKILKRMK